MPRIRHTGGHGSILTAKGGKGKSGKYGDPFNFGNQIGKSISTGAFTRYTTTWNGAAVPSNPLISDDGTKLIETVACQGNSADTWVNEYLLSTPWNVSARTIVHSLTYTSTSVGGQAISRDGKKLYIYNRATKKFRCYEMSSAWSLASRAAAVESGVIGPATWFHSMIVTDDGRFIYGINDTTIYKFVMSTPWDVTTLSADGIITLSGSFFPSGVSVPSSYIRGMLLDPEGRTLVIYSFGSGGGMTKTTYSQFSLSAPFDISVAGRSFEGGIESSVILVHSEADAVTIARNGKYAAYGLEAGTSNDGFAIQDVMPWYTLPT